MKTSARTFYKRLYTQDLVDEDNILRYLSDATFDKVFGAEDQSALLAPISIDDLISQASRQSSKSSSPGSDGLGYAFLSLLFSFPP
jgi:hypothetical protein